MRERFFVLGGGGGVFMPLVGFECMALLGKVGFPSVGHPFCDPALLIWLYDPKEATFHRGEAAKAPPPPEGTLA